MKENEEKTKQRESWGGIEEMRWKLGKEIQENAKICNGQDRWARYATH